MEDSKITKIIRALIVIVVMAAALIICMRILVLKSEDGIKQMESYYLQEEDTVDALLMGSSHIYCDVNTGVLWDEYGISAYDLGGAEQPYWNTYYFLKEAVKTQKPKVIVIDVTIPGIRSVEYQPEVWSVTNLYGIKWNRNRIDATRASTQGDIFDRVINPFNTMHTRYDELTKDDFVDENRSINYKGFDMREAVVPFEMRDMSDINDTKPMTEKEETYFRKIIEFTKENNIPLLLVSVPFPVYRYEGAQEIYNYEFMIAGEEGIPYIDFNKGHYDKMGLDFSTDLADEFHLNTSGNEKFSKYLGNILVEQYGLVDHRGDKKYSSWDVDAYKQRLERNNNTLAYAQHEPSEFAKNVLNEGYYAFVNISRGLGEGLDENMSESLEIMGIPGDKQVSGSAYILKDGEIISENTGDYREAVREGSKSLLFTLEKEGDTPMNVSLFVNDDEYKEEYDNLLFVYDYVNGIFVDKVHF